MRALSSPPCGSTDIQWSVEEKPLGSTVANPPNGETATITPDLKGRYIVKAQCGETSKVFTLYAYIVIFEWNANFSHKGTEAKKSGYQDRMILGTIYSKYESTPDYATTPLFGSSQFLRMMMFARTEGYNVDNGGGWDVQPSGEIFYDIYVDVGNANTTAHVQLDYSAATSKTSAAYVTVRNGTLFSLTNGSSSMSWSLICDGTSILEVGNATGVLVRQQPLSGKTYVGRTNVGAGFQDLRIKGPPGNLGSPYWEADCKAAVAVKLTS